MERYLSANDAARILNVTAQSVHVMVRRGELRVAGTTESGIRLFRREDVESLAQQRAARHEETRNTVSQTGKEEIDE
jgi:DNA-binding transcriptional MerR regulator